MYKLDTNKEHKDLKDMKSVTWEQRNKGTNPFANKSRNFHKQPYSNKRPHVRCWNYNESHYARDCPHKKGDNIHNMEELTIGDVSKTQRIYAYLEGRHADHQSHMIEVAGKIGNKSMSILIDSRASNNYVAPNVVLNFSLNKSNLEVNSLYS